MLRTISGIIPFKKGSIIYNVEKSDVKFIMKLIKRIGLESLIKDEIDLFEKKPNDFGDKFSGGKSQKILILRVLYNKPKIVLFDKEFRDITILSIIHDYSELKYYDKIVEL